MAAGHIGAGNSGFGHTYLPDCYRGGAKIAFDREFAVFRSVPHQGGPRHGRPQFGREYLFSRHSHERLKRFHTGAPAQIGPAPIANDLQRWATYSEDRVTL